VKNVFDVNAWTLTAALAGLMAIGGVSASPARAQSNAEPLHVIANKATILRLAKPAQQVIIGDPRFVDVTVETRTMLILFGRAPGETNLIILDSQNREILSAPVLVSDEKDRHISIVSSTRSGLSEVVYNCDRRCVRVALQGAAPAPSSGGGAQGPVASEPVAAPPPGEPPAQPAKSSPDDRPPASGSYKR
jgi:hypothetical protein